MALFHVIQHLEREGPGLFTMVAAECGLELKTYRPDLGDDLPIPESGEGLLVLGGPMGVGDLDHPQFPWLRDELQLIKQALNQQIPIVGVCLGAQLLAFADGGEIVPLNQINSNQPQAEVGWAPIMMQKKATDELILRNLPTEMDVLHWHGDRIILPNSAILLASSARCKEQMFRIGSSAYGLQFHVEIESQELNQWIHEDKEFIRRARGKDAADLLLQEQQIFAENSRSDRVQLLRELLRLVAINL